MKFEEDKSMERLGEKFGFVFSYFIFASLLFLIMLLTKKLPKAWSYLHVMAVAIAIILVGLLLKRLLK